ncbi:MAG: DUF932 domain-containing protein [Chloroherpetonaceae bacterium]
MAHNLRNFVSRKEHAWHQLGFALDSISWKDILEKGGLGYDVQKDAIYRVPKNFERIIETMKMEGDISADKIIAALNKIEGKFATYRTDEPQHTFGIVGEDYEIFQNTEMKTIVETLLNESDIVYETAGVLGNGEKCWLMARLPEQMEIAKDDTINKYLLISQGFNGIMGLRVSLTPIRVVCENTLNLALRTTKTSYSFRHTKNINEQINDAIKALKMVDTATKHLQDLFNAMANFKMNREQYLGYYRAVKPSEPSQPAISDLHLEWLDNAIHGAGANMPHCRETLWGAYNGLVEAIDFSPRTMKKPVGKRVHYTVFGSGADIKSTALNVAEKVVEKGYSYIEELLHERNVNRLVKVSMN